MAKVSFVDGSDGARLFYTSGPWSRPYLVPDAATEERLLARQSWIMAVVVLVLLPLVSFSTTAWDDPRIFGLIIVVALVAQHVVSSVLLRPVLAGLSKSAERAPLGVFYRGTAERHGFSFLVFCLILSCVFFLFSIGSLFTRVGHPIVAVTGTVIFGLVSASWVYVLLLKLRMRRAVSGRTA
jgi:hypothetical protein